MGKIMIEWKPLERPRWSEALRQASFAAHLASRQFGKAQLNDA